jgi:hypothetical protein
MTLNAIGRETAKGTLVPGSANDARADEKPALDSAANDKNGWKVLLLLRAGAGPAVKAPSRCT